MAVPVGHACVGDRQPQFLPSHVCPKPVAAKTRHEVRPMPEDFKYAVFLSHSSKDKPVVRPIADRLTKDGLKVWLDDWEIRPGDSIPHKIEEGLESSRVMVLCMSANAFGSDWTQLEGHTFRFRDPLNKDRRFVPLRLDDAPIKGSLAQFLYINWLPEAREQEYVKLLQACRPPAKASAVEPDVAREHIMAKVLHLSCEAEMLAYAFSPTGGHAVTGASDNTVRVWDLAAGRCVQVLQAEKTTRKGDDVFSLALSADHRLALFSCYDNILRLRDIETGLSLSEIKASWEYAVALTSDQGRAISGGIDNTVRLWDLKTGRCLHVFKGHSQSINCVAFSADDRRALSGSRDWTMRLWDVETGQCLRVLNGHKGWIWSIAWSLNGRLALSGSRDRTMRLWDVETGQCLRIFEGHKESVNGVAWNPNQGDTLSCSDDGTLRLWDTESGRCLGVLEGHKESVRSVAWSDDGRRAFSGDAKGGIRVWDLSEFVTRARAPKTGVPALRLAPDQVQYTNAKVLLVGESGVGKTGLSNYLAHGIKVEDDKPLPSTDGAWATHWPLKHDKKKAGVEREIWLWDFAGQVDYRLVHQLFMDDTATAVLVFNPQNENPFEGLGNWDRDLQKAARKPFAKLLAAARVDRGGLVVSAASMKKFMKERDFLGPLHVTSAKTGEGCDQLREAIVQAIDWKSIPETTSPALYRRLKQEILRLRDSGLVLIRLVELKQRMEMTLQGENFEVAELEAVVGLLAGPGMIQRLGFGGFILLRPEVLSRYAAAVVRKVRKHPQELGSIREDELLAGNLDYQDFKRLPREDEAVVLRTLLETFISRAWCLRQPCEGSAMLTFPSYFRRERKEQPSHPSVLVTYRFDGPADEIYATLVVRLHHTMAFQSTDLWKSAADFRTQTGQKLGFTLTRESEGTSLLEVYFEPDVDDNSRVLFLRYVHDHLMQHAQNVVRLRRYFCGNTECDSYGKQFAEQTMIDKSLARGGKGKVFCSDCGKPILLRDVIEEKFESASVKEQVREMQSEGQAVIDNESCALILVGHVFSIASEAGQSYRSYPASNHGIDGEIEFKDDQGRSSDRRVYLILNPDVVRYQEGVYHDPHNYIVVQNANLTSYWVEMTDPVMAVVGVPHVGVYWMDLRAYLKRHNEKGNKPATKIIFDGERFDMMSVRRWRERVLSQGVP
jgi:WD40 repeat protein/GTPase SAR1 family protein